MLYHTLHVCGVLGKINPPQPTTTYYIYSTGGESNWRKMSAAVCFLIVQVSKKLLLEEHLDTLDLSV